MDFSSVDGAVSQAYQGYPFEFSPSALAILLMQACQVTDGLSNGNGFNVDNLPNDFEVHAHPSEVGWQLQVPAVACRPTALFSRRRSRPRDLRAGELRRSAGTDVSRPRRGAAFFHDRNTAAV